MCSRHHHQQKVTRPYASSAVIWHSPRARAQHAGRQEGKQAGGWWLGLVVVRQKQCVTPVLNLPVGSRRGKAGGRRGWGKAVFAAVRAEGGRQQVML